MVLKKKVGNEKATNEPQKKTTRILKKHCYLNVIISF